MNLRTWSRNWFNNYYHEDMYGHSERRLLPVVHRYMGEMEGPVLDAGCGFRNPYLKDLHLSNTVGMDIDPKVQKRNKLHQSFIIGDLHRLSAREQFEGIISVNAWEHLHSPESVLKNFYNALSDQGVVIIIAPKRCHYISLIERLIPEYVEHVAWRILKGRDRMPYPAYYRLCSKKTLLEAARRQGFSVEHFSSVDRPPLWFAKIPPLFILACFWMSMVNNYGIFENIRGAFIAVLRKV